MKAIFIDTLYGIALINPKDQWHDRAAQVRDSLEPFKGITTEPRQRGITEVLSHDRHFAQEGLTLLL